VPFIAKLRSRKCTTAAALARFILVPAFYFTAKYGEQGYMIFLTSLLGLSNGYLTVCVLTVTVTEAPKGYKYNVTFTLLYTSRHQLLKDRFFFSLQSFAQGPEQNALGNVLVVFVMTGLFSGVVLDWLWLIGKGW
jgi:solute carrier family 29 (equilibrative nucleoside transporter), member 1/2/3